MEPLVSVLIPAYNAEKTIAKTIQSVINQTHKNWECIILNDGSTDSTENICFSESINESRIQYRYQTNAGIVETRKSLIKMMNGEYCFFLDADDLIHPQTLELLLSIALKDDEIDIVMTSEIQNISKVFEIGKKKKRINNELYCELFDGKEIAQYFLTYPKYNVGMTSKLFSRKIKYTKFDIIPNLFVGEDSIMNSIIFLECNKVAVINERLYFYRYGGNSNKYYDLLARDIANLYCTRKKIIFENDFGIELNNQNLINCICMFNSICEGTVLDCSKIYNDLLPILNDAIFYNLNLPVINFYNEFKNKKNIKVKKNKERLLIKLKRMILANF